MLVSGVYPASVTPFGESGKVSHIEIAKLLAYFEASGCKGAVLAGTNGEGPSLTAIEKRELIENSKSSKGKLQIVLGIASSSLEEGKWLCRRAQDGDADAVLVLPPSYFRAVTEAAIGEWFLELLEASPIPVLVYNFPKMSGITITAELINVLREHSKFLGAKDSSGDHGNLTAFRQAAGPGALLFVGDERLLLDALKAGWNGTISGVANTIPDWLCAVMNDWVDGNLESAETKFQIILPIIEALRSMPQPATHKRLLSEMKVIGSERVRLPLSNVTSEFVAEVKQLIEQRLGALLRL